MRENTPNELDDSTRICLDEADWPSVLPPVLKYAEAQAKKYKWLGVDVDPDDLVQNAIQLAYSGQRKWDREKCPRLDKFLIGIIRSITSHNAEHENNFPKESIFDVNGKIKNNLIYNSKDKKDSFSAAGNPENELVENEKEKILEDTLKKIASEDDELGMVILCLEDGINKRSKIAEETNFDINKVYNLIRKLKRKLDQYI